MGTSWSKWELHPDLQAALEEGRSFKDWLGGLRPGGSYARISRDLNDEIGVGRQHRNNDEFAAENDVKIVVRWTDNDITAVDPDIERPAFLRMVRDIRARRCEEGYPVHGIISVEEYRVARLPEDYLKLHRALTVDDSGFFGIKDSNTFLDVHSDSELLRGLLTSAMGEIEVKKLKKRTKRNARDKAVEGVPTGTKRLGWMPADPASGRKCNESLDPIESPILRRALEARLKGKSWRSINLAVRKELSDAAKLLEKEIEDGKRLGALPVLKQVDYLKKRADKLSIPATQYMVTNPQNCGYRMIDNEIVRDPKTDEPIIGKWGTICTPDEWYRLARSYPDYFNPDGPNKKTPTGEKRKPGTPKRSKKRFADETRKYLNSGLFRCGHIQESWEICLGAMNGSPPSKSNPFGSYRCTRPGCGKVSRRMDLSDKVIEKIVTKVLLRNYANKPLVVKEWYGQETLDKLIENRLALKARFTSGEARGAFYLDMLKDLDEKIKDAEADKAQFQKEIAAENMLSGFSMNLWENKWDLRQKRIAINAVLSAVIVHPIPKDRKRNSPFDPTLLEPIFREGVS